MTTKLLSAKKTKKKFYNKYIYKVSLNIPGSGSLRYYDISYILNLLTTYEQRKSKDLGDRPWRQKLIKDLFDNKDTWLQLIFLLNSYDSSTWSKRLEGNTIDFYTNDRPFYDILVDTFPKFIAIRFEPEQGNEKRLLESTREIFVKKLPHDVYNYRIYLKPHKLKLSHDERLALVGWMDAQKPKITFTDSIKDWIIKTKSDWDRRYIHVDSEATILMIKLRAPELIGQVFKYVKTDK